MNAKTATTRESARKKLLDEIQRNVADLEDCFGPLEAYQIFLLLLSRKLVFSRGRISTKDFPEISLGRKMEVFHLFCKAADEIRRFQRSEKEGKALFAKLLEWTASEIARPHHAALQTQEVLCRHTMDKVSFG
ncbi:MAG: hypothetical protein WC814_00965 [Candidatus Paceibacterota bacterium]|jgi:hypothetical protein